MTTVAWDTVTLAADRQSSCSGAVYRNKAKVVEIPGGYIACCGDVGEISKFLAWHRSGRKKKCPPVDSIDAIAIVKGGVRLWHGDAEVICDPNEKLAIGAGWKWAMAAMDFGRTALEAVEYASTRDNATGGGVDFVTPKRGKKHG